MYLRLRNLIWYRENTPLMMTLTLESTALSTAAPTLHGVDHPIGPLFQAWLTGENETTGDVCLGCPIGASLHVWKIFNFDRAAARLAFSDRS